MLDKDTQFQYCKMKELIYDSKKQSLKWKCITKNGRETN